MLFYFLILSFIFAEDVYEGYLLYSPTGMSNDHTTYLKDIDGTTLTIANDDGSVFDASNLDASNTLYFLDEHHGAGGTTTEGVEFPKGVTIYGRWTTITPSAAPVICYFGK